MWSPRMRRRGWFNKCGYKCINCQDAINKRGAPGSLCSDNDYKRSIPDTDSSMEIDVKVATLRKYKNNISDQVLAKFSSLASFYVCL